MLRWPLSRPTAADRPDEDDLRVAQLQVDDHERRIGALEIELAIVRRTPQKPYRGPERRQAQRG